MSGTTQKRPLSDYAKTAFQADIADLAEQGYDSAYIAEAVQASSGTVRKALSRLRACQAAAGAFLPEEDPGAAPGFNVTRVSERRGPKGQLLGYHVRKESDSLAKRQEAFLDAVNEAFEHKGAAFPVAVPDYTSEELLAVYPIGDPHIGMYAYAQESGDDFDCEIAERELIQAHRTLVLAAPPAKTALIIPLGDNIHMDNPQNRTARSGHVLDVDTRWGRVFRITVRAIRATIDMALTKHEKVHVFVIGGNHDDHSSIALAICLEMFYANEPRVVVDTSLAAHRYFRFGKNRIGITHGHNGKLEELEGIMTADVPEGTGETPFRYWYTGHVHHLKRIEKASCVIESFRTMAPKDAYAAGRFRARQAANQITLHKDFGEVSRLTADVLLVRAGLKS